jgi:hypothetical protein
MNQSLTVLQPTKALKAGKATSPNGISNVFLTHLPKRAVTFLTKVFNAVLRTQYFPPPRKHARVESVLQPAKDPALSSSCIPISLLNVFEKLVK